MNEEFDIMTVKNIDFISTLEQRSIGATRKPHIAPYDLQVHAEDVFVNKKFDELHCEVPDTPRSTFLMVFSPDGSKIASTHGNHNIYVTDSRTGKNIRTLSGHPRTPWCIAFHPTSNQILASGCLGGQVRIWDLSGGSEIWTSDISSVIASIAFHPDDRLLVIATCNELHFWDWSKPEPFMSVSTGNIKEKVRYVAFDKLGTKLITGVSNCPQMRWERARAPVPVPRQADGSGSPYRRRITPRLVSQPPPLRTSPHTPPRHRATSNSNNSNSPTATNHEPLSTVPERERRITACYRNLVREYELLVHRYIQIYQPPTMIDQGTDPMEEEEIDLSTITGVPTPSTSGRTQMGTPPGNSSGNTPDTEPQPSTSTGLRSARTSASSNLTERRFGINKPISTIGTQTSTGNLYVDGESPQLNMSQVELERSLPVLTPSEVCALRCAKKTSGSTQTPDLEQPSTSGVTTITSSNKTEGNDGNKSQENASQTPSPRRMLLISPKKEDRTLNEENTSTENSLSPIKIKCTSNPEPLGEPQPGTSRSFLPKSPPKYKFFDQNRKRSYPGCPKKNRRRILITSDSSSDDDDDESHTKKPCHEQIPQKNTSTAPKETPTTPKETPTTPKETLTAPTETPTPNITPSSAPTVPSCTPTSNATPSALNSPPVRRPLNFNRELEMLVTDLLADNNSSPGSNDGGAAEHSSRVCSTCGVNVDESRSTPHSRDCDLYANGFFRRGCGRHQAGTSGVARGATGPPVPRRRFYTHRYSAFNPASVVQLRPLPRPPAPSNPSPTRRICWRSFNIYSRTNRNPTFASDEVINYSERAGNEEEGSQDQPATFHPFDPPPEFATINPENIGIGNMYSNIVQELESSLNDVRNLRPGNRLGETSDMLSSFSERLESIMNQSNAILRNLRTSIETLTPNTEQATPPASNDPQVHFSDNTFYLRDQSAAETTEPSFDASTSSNNSSPENLFASHNAVAADHTYPLNSRNSAGTATNMSPLMASLHLTVSHIQRQARLLRQQVESIESIDRAMLEVAQLQMLRQMFMELQRYFRLNTENRHAVSSVRQMMAGARISDSSPYDSPSEETTSTPQEGTSRGPPAPSDTNQTQARGPRKNFPRCIFFMNHRNNPRRTCLSNILHRRLYARDRVMRRQLHRRGINCRNLLQGCSVGAGSEQPAPVENLRTMVRRLETFLLDHGENIGRVIAPGRVSATVSYRDEFALMFRLNECRTRIFAQSGLNHSIRRQTNSVTVDGASRFSAREMLTTAAERLIRYIMYSSNFPSIRSLISDVLDLSLLLSEILLLQIVDSIPPPSGMNLDTERENLSYRIDNMCSRMLNRLSGNSQELTRSLRLTRLAVRHASHALNQTYAARRNSMLPTNSYRDQRRALLEEINTCLRNIRRHETTTQQPGWNRTGSLTNPYLSMTEWYQTIYRLISRYRNASPSPNQPSTSSTEGATAPTEETPPTTTTPPPTNSTPTPEQPSSDDDDEQPPNPDTSPSRSTPLYRTNNVNLFNLLNNEESTATPGTSSRSRPWNVPLVQVNDEPLPSQQFSSPWQSSVNSYLNNRQRLSERFAELRTYPVAGLFRPRFLHPLYSGVMMDNDFDDSVREQIYDTTDMITPVTPNHRIQVWEFSNAVIPSINDSLRNIVVNECKIHNDASVDIASDGSILVTLLPTGGYLNGTTRLGVYSLDWESLGQCLYIANFEQNAVSVSLSPLNRHLVVGLASRRVSMMPSERWIMARIFALDDKRNASNQLSTTRDVEQIREPNFMSVNCIRWLPVSGQGLVYGTNTGQLRIFT